MCGILLFAPLYPPYGGGSPTYFSNLVTSLSEEHTFLIITAYHPDELVVTQTDGNTIYRVIPFVQSLPATVRLLGESLTAFSISLYLFLFNRVELAHIHATSYASPAIAVAAAITDVPVLYDCRDLSFPPWIVNIGRAPRVFSCAPNVDTILEQTGVPENEIIRVPIVNPEYVGDYAVATETAGDESSDTFDIVYVGNIRTVKGVGKLIEAFDEFVQERDDARLRIIGSGPYMGNLQKYVAEAGLKNHVDIMGEISHHETLEYIARADVLVHPSVRETGPRSVTEAIELGTTIVATSVGIVPEIVEHDETGLIIDRTVDSIRDSLVRLYENPSFRESLAERARTENQIPSWKVVQKTVSETYYLCMND